MHKTRPLVLQPFRLSALGCAALLLWARNFGVVLGKEASKPDKRTTAPQPTRFASRVTSPLHCFLTDTHRKRPSKLCPPSRLHCGGVRPQILFSTCTRPFSSSSSSSSSTSPTPRPLPHSLALAFFHQPPQPRARPPPLPLASSPPAPSAVPERVPVVET